MTKMPFTFTFTPFFLFLVFQLFQKKKKKKTIKYSLQLFSHPQKLYKEF